VPRPALIALVLGLLVAQAGTASTEQRGYDVRYGPLTVLRIDYLGRENANSYAAAARIAAAGIISLFAPVSFDIHAEGRHNATSFQPVSYREDVETGRRSSTVELRYSGNRPELAAISPEEAFPWDVALDDQRGTVDPMTALHRLGRPNAAADVCGWQLGIFDGRRRTRVVLGPPARDGDSITCAGTYDRIGGFSPEEMDRHTSFGFSVRFSPVAGDGDLWELSEARAQTIYGNVTVRRR